MAIAKIYKRIQQILVLVHTVSEIQKYKLCLHSASNSLQESKIFAIRLFDGKCQYLQKTSHIHFCADSYRFNDINILIFTFRKQVKVTQHNFRKYTIRWQISKSTKVSLHTFCGNFYCFRDLKLLNILSTESISRLRCTIFAMTTFDGK